MCVILLRFFPVTPRYHAAGVVFVPLITVASHRAGHIVGIQNIP